MKEKAEKSVMVIKKKSGVVEALIYSIIPFLVVTYLLSSFWNLAGNDQVYAVVPNLFWDIIAYKYVVLYGIIGLLGLNLLVYYVLFRIARKVVACPWCCVTICLQVIAVGYCVALFL